MRNLAFEKGKKEGEKTGIKKGLEQGQKQKALETARKMLSKGYELAEITELTGLSIDDLAALSSK